MTVKEIHNTIELIRIRRQEIAHSPHPHIYKDEYISLINEEEALEQELKRRWKSSNIGIFQPWRKEGESAYR